MTNHKTWWDKLLTIVLTALTPVMIWGAITLIRDDMKINIIWNAGYVDENRIMEIVNLLNARNQILDVKYLNAEKNIDLMMQDIRTIDNRIDMLSNTTRALKIDDLLPEKDTASLDEIMKKWRK